MSNKTVLGTLPVCTVPSNTLQSLVAAGSVWESLSSRSSIQKRPHAQLETVTLTSTNQVNNLGCIKNQTNIFYERKKIVVETNLRFNVPERIDTFRGREKQFETLDTIFTTDKMAVVCGFPGSGKSELVNQYAMNNAAKFDANIIWINAENEATLTKSFRDLGRLLDVHHTARIKIVVDQIYSYFHQKKTLVILDNAPSRRIIQPFLPSSEEDEDGNVHLLITTQNCDWGPVKKVRLKELSREPAREVFGVILGRFYKQKDVAKYDQLLDGLNRFPLTVQVAAAYIQESFKSDFFNDLTVEDYTFELKRNESLLINEEFPGYSSNQYDKTIFAAVKTSIDKISQVEKSASSALDLINVCAYLDPECLSHRLLLSSKVVNGSKMEFSRALTVLKNYSLIISESREESSSNKMVYLHTLVQTVIRHQHFLDGSGSKYYEIALEIVLDDKYTGDSSHVLQFAWLYIAVVLFLYKKSRSMRLLIGLVKHGQKTALEELFKGLTKEELRAINKEQLIYEAVSNTQLPTLQFLLEEFTSELSATKYKMWPYLHVAAQKRHLPSIEYLINHQVDINVEDYQKQTPIFALFDPAKDEEQVVTLVMWFVGSGARLDARTNKGKSILQRAIELKYLNVVQYLIEECHMDESLQYLPFYTRIEGYNHQKIIGFLQWLTTYSSNNQESNISQVIKRRYKNLLQYFEQHYSDDPKEPTIENMLQGFKINEELSIFYWYLFFGPEIRDQTNQSFLHKSTKVRNKFLMSYFITEYHLDLNAKDANGNTPFHILLQQKRVEDQESTKPDEGFFDESEVWFLCSLFIPTKLENVNSVNSEGRTLLHEAVKSKHLQTAIFLIEHCRADIFLKDNMGRSFIDDLLKQSFCQNQSDSVHHLQEILERQGVDFNLRHS